MSDIHFQGIWRMDWGLGNPNTTAALISMLMITVWGLAFIRKGKNHWGFVGSLSRLESGLPLLWLLHLALWQIRCGFG